MKPFDDIREAAFRALSKAFEQGNETMAQDAIRGLFEEAEKRAVPWNSETAATIQRWHNLPEETRSRVLSTLYSSATPQHDLARAVLLAVTDEPRPQPAAPAPVALPAVLQDVLENISGLEEVNAYLKRISAPTALIKSVGVALSFFHTMRRAVAAKPQ